jgi:CRISPR/Cas system-associated endonuclease Cas1
VGCDRGSSATGPIDTPLNYAYALLESEIRIAVASRGLDSTLGYIHASRSGLLALVYDLMEPLRPRVDEQVLTFVRTAVLSPADLVRTTTRVCRLHPRLSLRVAHHTMPAEAVRAVVDSAVLGLLSGTEGPIAQKRGGMKESGVVRRGRPSSHVSSSTRRS